MQVWTSNGCNNQKFKFVKEGEETPTGTKTINDGTYQIQTAEDTSKVVDIGGSSTQDGTNIGVWENSSTANQKFNIKYRNDGYYTISAMHSGNILMLQEAQNKMEQLLTNGSTMVEITNSG